MHSYRRLDIIRFCFLPDCKASLQDRLGGDVATGSEQNYDNES